MNVSIICPLYNAEKYIIGLNKSLLSQKNVDIESIKYILTESNDKTEALLKKFDCNYNKINQGDFSHSITREKAALNAKGDIIVFISQDIIINNSLWLYYLTKDIISGKCEAAFSRQISKNDGIEKYIRLRNYPKESRIVNRNDIERLGLDTFFFSDASSAILKDIFIKLNGYDNKDLIISEDMYLAYKIITNGYRIKYCSDSVVIHSHDYTFKQLYKRYYDTGIFFKENNYLQNYSANNSGLQLTKFVTMKCIENKDYKSLLNLIPNFITRFIGMKMGEMNLNVFYK